MKQTIKEVKVQLEAVTSLDDDYFKACLQDERKGVQQAIKATQKRIEKEKELAIRFESMKSLENQAKNLSFQYIAGIDEVGRGPLAGPVVAAAVILPSTFDLVHVYDSKQLSKTMREDLYTSIYQQAIAIGIGIIDEKTIDKVNIYEATKLAMKQAIDQLEVSADYLLIDAMTLDVDIEQKSVIKGDTKSISIACASIIAKVTRDRLMSEYDQMYPGYEFESNSGYGTAKHLEKLRELGATPVHRRSFEPVKSMFT